MPLISRTPTRTYFITMFVVVSVLFAAFSAVIYRNYSEAQRLNQWTLYNYEVIRQSRKIMLDLVDMETGVRGYLITGQRRYLQPYSESKATLKKQIDALWDYTKNDPSTQDNIDVWLKNIEKFSATLIKQIERYDQSFFDKTPTKIMDRQKQQMDGLRTMLEKFVTIRLEDLNNRLTQAKKAENNFRYILALGTALAIGGMLTATLVMLALLRNAQLAEDKSAAIENRFRTVMNGVNDGLFDYDVIKNTVYYSPQYKAMLGYAEEDVSDSIDWFNATLHPDDAESTWKVFEDYRKRLTPAYRNVFRLQKKNGDWIWILSRGVGLFDAQGNLTRLIGAHTDISEQKQREEELAALNREMEAFTYITSHDLRAPLVNLKGFSGELMHALKRIQPIVAAKRDAFSDNDYATLAHALEEDIPESLRFIVQSVERMDTLTTAVLDLSRIGKREYRQEVVDTAALVQRCIDSLAYEIAQKHITVDCAPLPEVVSDALALEQVFSNILDNAVKYLDPERPGEISIRAETAGSMIIFSVSDNGRGIAKADHDKVFHIFRRARNSIDVRGSGLGMAFVQASVRRLGGSIWFISTENVGSTFFFSIPHKLPAKGASHA